ncbi:MAG: NADH-quinone oxidoreductase subunit J [Candidatus Omnitrophica bacterium]|nr:NADH-quinone oxidoreductase subunit J [Candidatus Omnitrophota bacterium]
MTFALLLLAAMVLAGAVWVVTLRNLFRAALSLGVVLLGVAGLFLLLEAEFLAFVQILIYVGAILTLVVFAIMLTARLQGTPGTAASPASRQRVGGALAALALFAVLAGATQPLLWPEAPPAGAVPLAALGQQLVTRLILPFEVISLVFVAAIVGAIAIASGPPGGARPR